MTGDRQNEPTAPVHPGGERPPHVWLNGSCIAMLSDLPDGTWFNYDADDPTSVDEADEHWRTMSVHPEPVIVTRWADGSTPQASTVDEPESDFGYDGFPPAPTPPTEDELGPWCCYAGEVGHPTSECSPENPIHAPTHCGYDNVRRGLVPAPPTVTDTDTVAVPRSALDRLIGCHRFFCMSGTSPCCPAGEWIAAAGVSSDR